MTLMTTTTPSDRSATFGVRVMVTAAKSRSLTECRYARFVTIPNMQLIACIIESMSRRQR